jgi:serine/threonine protein phosphatase PrpC
VLCDRQGKVAESREWYEKARAARGATPDFLCNLGYSRYLQGRWSDAESCLREALALAPDHRRAHNNLGLVLAHGGREQEALAEFRKALGRADERVCAEAREHPELYGMGTTLTTAYAFRDELYVVHVGDSRCYLLRDGTLRQVTSDHTMAQEMLRAGLLGVAEAARHQWRHVITNAVGGSEPGVRPEVHKLDLRPGDCLLLCSDGLSEMVPDAEIAAVLRQEADPRRACERLVAEANARGGRDNITAVVARFEEPAA